MRFKTIAAVIATREEADRVLDVALPLAAEAGGHLIALHAESIPVVYASEVGFPDAGLIQASAETSRQRSDEIGALVSARAGEAGVGYEWRLFENLGGDGSQAALAAVRAADLIVAAQPDRDGDAPAADLEALLFDAGRPLLMVPRDGPSTATFRRVLLAWNGSREAARAAFDALPFMLAAASTEILVVSPREQPPRAPPEGADIAAALERHGAQVFVVSETARGRAAEEVIRARVADAGIDLLVLGAYGHSWLRELLFGGVTRSVMRSLPVATFLSR